MKKISKKLSATILGVCMTAAAVTGCSSGGKEAQSESGTEASGKNGEVQVELTFFSNLPNRTSGEGLLEQSQIDAYEQEHPNVKIKVEALQDDAYEAKLQAYMQSGNMPDIYNIWAAPYFFNPLTAGNFAAELNPADYESWGYVPGALEAFMKDGKLYGTPKTVDFWTVLYNEALFEQYGVPVPETVDEYLEAAEVFGKDGISLVSVGGKEVYTLSNTIQNLIIRTTGDAQKYRDELYAGTLSEDPDVLEAANIFKTMVDGGVFAPSFNQDDYGTARNLFIQGKSAMFFCGSWEMGIGADTTIDEEMRSHIRAAKFPVVEGGKGEVDQLQEWFGSGYAVSSSSPNKEVAIDFLNYIMQPDVFAKFCWEQQTKIPPMDFTKYRTIEETLVQQDLMEILDDGVCGSFDCFTYDISASFGANASRITTEFTTGITTPEEFLKALDEAALQEKNK